MSTNNPATIIPEAQALLEQAGIASVEVDACSALDCAWCQAPVPLAA